jgi:hypothetical protein
MDHQAIDAESTAERYVTGRLPPEEAARFEEHYLDCPACRARVEAAERLQRGLRRLAEQAATGGPDTARADRFRRSPWLGLVAAALFGVALLPAWLELRQVQRLRSDLATAREALVRGQREQGSTERLNSVLGELAESRRDLAAAAAQREALAREMATDRQPQANVPVVPLTSARGGGPVRAVKLPEKPGWVAFWVEPGDADFPAYRATLRSAEGAVTFQGSRLALNDAGALLVMVHSTALAKGAYRLEVDGLPPAGAPVPVGRFSLRID